MKKESEDFLDNDFGFSAVSEEELKALEKKLSEDVKDKAQKLEEVETTYKGKLEQLHRTIMPLLKNLAANPEKEYIYWPNRSDKIKEFIARVDRILKDD